MSAPRNPCTGVRTLRRVGGPAVGLALIAGALAATPAAGATGHVHGTAKASCSHGGRVTVSFTGTGFGSGRVNAAAYLGKAHQASADVHPSATNRGALKFSFKPFPAPSATANGHVTLVPVHHGFKRLIAPFTFHCSTPQVTKVSPHSGASKGGNTVTVHGFGFTNVQHVLFGATAGTNIQTKSSTTVTVRTPKHKPGTVDVRVVTKSDHKTRETPPRASDHYTYKSPPPPPVSGLTYNLTYSSVELRWTNPSDPTFAGVVIRRATGATPPGSPTDGKNVGETKRSDVSFVDRGLSRRTSYSYALFSVNSAGESGLAATITIATSGHPTWAAPTQVGNPPQGGAAYLSCGQTACAAIDGFGNVSTFDGATWTTPTNIFAPQEEGSDDIGISCATATFCAVAHGVSVRTYDGSAWSSPVVVDDKDLSYISCPLANYCMALDASNRAITFDGTDWSKPVSLGPKQHPESLSCASETLCAVAESNRRIQTYNGSSWTSTEVEPSKSNSVESISCASSPPAQACLLGDSAGRYSVFDGSEWSSLATASSSVSTFYYIACASSDECRALAGGAHGTLVSLTYDGTAWSTSSSPPAESDIEDLSCASATLCVVLSREFDDAVDDLTIDANWTTESGWSSPVTVFAAGVGLGAVSCPTTEFCGAIGGGGNGNLGTPAYTLNGQTWSPATVLSAAGDRVDLSSISCTRHKFCVAVDVDYGRAFVYDGSEWSSGSELPHAPSLTSVSCVSHKFCLAVDSLGSSFTYNGSVWSKTKRLGDEYLGPVVSCVSADFCVAVGYGAETFYYNGSKWSQPPSMQSDIYDPTSISCTSRRFCAVAGDSKYGAYDVSVFDGSQWRDHLANPNSSFTGVSCTSDIWCVAVSSDGSVAYYDAGSWTHPTNVDVQGFSDVSCPEATECYATDFSGGVSRMSAG